MGDSCVRVVAPAATTNNMTDFPIKMKADDHESNGPKKLMQARLPFKPLHQKVGKPVVANSKKRKSTEPDSVPTKFPKLLKQLSVDNKAKLNTSSHDNSDMEVCDEVISSSESGNTSLPIQTKVKSHTLDKFFTPRNVQDEIISSSTNDYIDLTKSDNEEGAAKGDDKLSVDSPEKEKENKLSDVFNENANDNFNCLHENQAKTNQNNKQPPLSSKVLREKYERTASPQDKITAEVRVVLQDVALCDLKSCSTPNSLKKSGNSDSKPSKSPTASPIKMNQSKGKDDTFSELDSSIVCDKTDNELLESLSTSVSSSHDISTQSPGHASGNSKTTPSSNNVKPKVSSAKKAQRDAQRQKIKEEKEQERLKRKSEKEAERLEKLEQRKKEKEMKEQEKQKEKDLKEKEKLEKKEILDKERLEKEKIKEDQRKKKQEIIDAKLEEKRKKDEERKLKEEEKQKEEEEKLRKQAKTKAAFQSFFVQKPKEMTSVKPKEQSSLFMPFEVKDDMRMAPSCRRTLSKEVRDTLETLMSNQKHETMYLEELKKGRTVKRKSFKTWPKEEEEQDCYHISHEEDVVKKVTYRVKLLQFHTNYRPPYYGTWRKKSSVLTPKFPWKQDTKLFDYEIDSDDEWEEEEPGESLSCSEGEEDKEEKEEEEEEEEGWMVPHGYLSEDEGCEEDEEVTPEMLKARQAAKAESWERQCKKQTLPHKAEHIGCVWECDQIEPVILHKLSEFKVCCIDGEFPIATMYNGVPKEMETESRSNNSFKRRKVPEEAMPDLIKFIHGNRSGIRKLVIEFQMYWGSTKNAEGVAKTPQGENTKPESNVDSTPGTPAASEKADSFKQTSTPKQSSTPNTPSNETDAPEDNFTISKRQLDKKIASIAKREKGPDYSKICWYVHPEVLKQYGLEDQPLKDKVAEAKIAEAKAAEAKAAAEAKLAEEAAAASQSNQAEAKTPTSKTSEKINKTPLRDQMSILSFAQTADKLNSSRSEAVCENLEAKSVDLKSPSNKLPRDQMSIMNFARPATAAAEKMAVDDDDDDVVLVSVQPSPNGKKVENKTKEISAVKTPVNSTESGDTPNGTVVEVSYNDFMDVDMIDKSDEGSLSVENFDKTAPNKVPTSPQSKANTVGMTSAKVVAAKNSTVAVNGMSTVPETSKENKPISTEGEP